MVGTSNFHTARTHCTDKKELQNQFKIIHCKLNLKDSLELNLNSWKNTRKKDKPQDRKNSLQQFFLNNLFYFNFEFYKLDTVDTDKF